VAAANGHSKYKGRSVWWPGGRTRSRSDAEHCSARVRRLHMDVQAGRDRSDEVAPWTAATGQIAGQYGERRVAAANGHSKYKGRSVWWPGGRTRSRSDAEHCSARVRRLHMDVQAGRDRSDEVAPWTAATGQIAGQYGERRVAAANGHSKYKGRSVWWPGGRTRSRSDAEHCSARVRRLHMDVQAGRDRSDEVAPWTAATGQIAGQYGERRVAAANGHSKYKGRSVWWPGAESNCRHADFQRMCSKINPTKSTGKRDKRPVCSKLCQKFSSRESRSANTTPVSAFREAQ